MIDLTKGLIDYKYDYVNDYALYHGFKCPGCKKRTHDYEVLIKGLPYLRILPGQRPVIHDFCDKGYADMCYCPKCDQVFFRLIHVRYDRDREWDYDINYVTYDEYFDKYYRMVYEGDAWSTEEEMLNAEVTVILIACMRLRATSDEDTQVFVDDWEDVSF